MQLKAAEVLFTPQTQVSDYMLLTLCTATHCAVLLHKPVAGMANGASSYCCYYSATAAAAVRLLLGLSL